MSKIASNLNLEECNYLPSRPFLFFFELPDEVEFLSLLFQRINIFKVGFTKFLLKAYQD